MTNLHERLDRLAGPTIPVTDTQMMADLERGRRALRRRRTVKGAATGVFAVAAVAAVISYGSVFRPADQVAAPTLAAPTPSAAATANATPSSAKTKTETIANARLVSYEGKQPKGYTIDKIPAGWEIQGDLPSVLTMAPIGAKDQDPHSWIGKIAIMLESEGVQSNPTGVAVKVNGKPAVIAGPEDATSTTKTLYVKQHNGIYLLVQIYDARGWTNKQIATFGAGVHVLSTAVQGHG